MKRPETPTTARASAALWLVVALALALVPVDVALRVGTTPEENVVTALLESFLHATSDGMSVMFAESVTSAHYIHATSKGEYALLHRDATRLSAPGRGCRRRRSR